MDQMLTAEELAEQSPEWREQFAAQDAAWRAQWNVAIHDPTNESVLVRVEPIEAPDDKA